MEFRIPYFGKWAKNTAKKDLLSFSERHKSKGKPGLTIGGKPNDIAYFFLYFSFTVVYHDKNVMDIWKGSLRSPKVGMHELIIPRDKGVRLFLRRDPTLQSGSGDGGI